MYHNNRSWKSRNNFTVKPRIDRTTLKTITIKVGRAHKWSVDVAGEPPATIVWVWRDSIALTNTERITIENRDYHTDFSIIDATRKDAGIYTLQAENKSGKDSESVELIVLGKSVLDLSLGLEFDSNLLSLFQIQANRARQRDR